MLIQAITYRALDPVTVTTSAVKLFGADYTRKSLTILNKGNEDMYVYPEDSNPNNNFIVPVGTGVDVSPPPVNAFYAYTLTGTTSAEIVEG